MENTSYKRFSVEIESESRLVKGLMVFDEKKSYTSCPRCNSKYKYLDHGEKHECVNCGLVVQRFGAGLGLIK